MKPVSRTSARFAQRGFTMIELIVVIVILGILASVALPRFTNMQRDARVARLNAARGAVTAAAAMIHGAALARQGVVQPNCPATGTAPTTINATTGNGQICTESGMVAVTATWPAGSLAGIIQAAGLAQGTGTAAPNPAQLQAEGYNVTIAGGVVTVQSLGGQTAANCSFTYTPAAGIGSAAAVGAVVTTGC